MKKAVIFDMDGVLIASEPVYQKRRQRFFEKYGIHLTEKQQLSFVGSNPPKMMATLFPNDARKQTEFLTAYRAYTAKHIIDYASILDPTAETFLKKLQQKGLTLAVASSGSQRAIEQVLTETGLASYFETYVSGESFEESKPHPAIYQATAEKLGYQPSECIAVEDSYYGVLAASQAGIDVLLLRNPFYHIEAPQAHAEIDKLIQVLDFV